MFQTLAHDETLPTKSYRPQRVEKAVVLDVDKAWREALREDADLLYSIAASYKSDLHGDELSARLAEAEFIYRNIEHFQHTNTVFAARWHLLNAASDVISALQAAVVSNDSLAKAYMHAAKIELGFYEIELNRSGAF